MFGVCDSLMGTKPKKELLWSLQVDSLFLLAACIPTDVLAYLLTQLPVYLHYIHADMHVEKCTYANIRDNVRAHLRVVRVHVYVCVYTYR